MKATFEPKKLHENNALQFTFVLGTCTRYQLVLHFMQSVTKLSRENGKSSGVKKELWVKVSTL